MTKRNNELSQNDMRPIDSSLNIKLKEEEQSFEEVDAMIDISSKNNESSRSIQDP